MAAPGGFHQIAPSTASQFQGQLPNYYAQSMPTHSAGVGGSGGFSAAPFTPSPFSVGGSSRPTSTQSNYSWGELGTQPPLTSSKRDQNWEKKRRLWLARKHSTQTPEYASPPFPPAPSTAFHESFGPPSPLTKFVAQQQQQQSPTPTQTQYQHPYPPPTAAGSAYGATAGPNPFRPPSSGPPPRTSMSMGVNMMPPRDDAMSGRYMSPAAPPTRGGLTTPSGYPNYSAMQAPPTAMTTPGTAMSMSSASGGASSRQPPGGRTNWSLYS
ncbi:hypothetical protein PINS_up008927 [Pythium insidiosum]|nr:hypothetical protein PINS_up008927 [Pythium insidiosum]